MYKTSHIIHVVISLLLIVSSSTVFCQSLKPAGIFGDHMILQRKKAVPVWGNSSPKEHITITFAGQSKTTRAGTNGKWMVELDPLEASTKEQDFEKSGIRIEGQVKDVEWMVTADGTVELVIAKNNEEISLLKLNGQ